MKIGSLFSGYGGLDMAVADHYGATVAWHVDNDPAVTAVLAHHWPHVPNHGDVKTVDWQDVEPVDIITAGYPCQPYSDAGLRRADQDDRYLWPEVARAIGLLGPELVVLENVRGHLGRGFDGVLGSLADLGYDTEWTTVRASDVGAPHRRERLFAVAQDANGATRDQRRQPAPGQTQGRWSRSNPGGRGGMATPDAASDRRHEGRTEPARLVRRPDAAERGATPADADGDGRQVLERIEPGVGPRRDLDGRGEVDWRQYEPAIRRWEAVLGRPAPAPTRTGSRGGRQLAPLFVEWLMGLAGGHVVGVPGLTRNAQLRLLGNGVVPQQAAYALRQLDPAWAVAS